MHFLLLLTLVPLVLSEICTVGNFKCAESGIKPQYSYCGAGNVAHRNTCGRGTVCIQSKASIECVYPKSELVRHNLAELEVLEEQLAVLKNIADYSGAAGKARLKSIELGISSSIAKLESDIEVGLGKDNDASNVDKNVAVVASLAKELNNQVLGAKEETIIPEIGKDNTELSGILERLVKIQSVSAVQSLGKTVNAIEKIKNRVTIAEDLTFLNAVKGVVSDISSAVKNSAKTRGGEPISQILKDIKDLAGTYTSASSSTKTSVASRSLTK